jgi:hypothetical protein
VPAATAEPAAEEVAKEDAGDEEKSSG